MLYLGAACLAVFWMCALWPNGPMSPWWGAASAAVGAVLLGKAVYLDVRAARPLTVLLALSLAVAIWGWPWPANLVAGVLCAAVLLSGASFGGRHLVGWLVAPALLLAAQMPFAYLVARMSIVNHYSSLLTDLVGSVSRIFRLDTGTLAGTLVVPGYEYPHVCALTWERLQPSFFVPFAVAVVGALCLAGRCRRVAVVVGCVGWYALVRFLSVQLLDAHYGDTINGLPWGHGWALVSWLPLVWLLAQIVPVSDARREIRTARALTPRSALWFVAAALVGVATVWGATFIDPGIRKPGRVLIDYSHSDWEPADRPLDTNWYGGLSTYNYYSFADYLSRYYHVALNRDQSVGDELLSNQDVLVVEMPTQRYEPAEREAIYRFIQRGGGLWLIGDHTNVFGTSGRLNQIGEDYGIVFNHDGTYDLGTGQLSLYCAPRYLAHPVVRHMPDFTFQSSCSLNAGWDWSFVIVGPSVRVLRVDYTTRNYFPDQRLRNRWRHDYAFGNILQCAAKSVGKGRVLALADSTPFSCFSMFLPGKPELALQSVEWLNHTNRFSIGRWWLLLLCVCCAVVMMAFSFRPPGPDAIVIAGLVVGSALGLRASDSLSMHSVMVPPPHIPYTECAFDTDLSSVDFAMPEIRGPDVGKTKSPYCLNLHTFFVWTQRVGLIPRVAERLSDLDTRVAALVVTNPERRVTPVEMDRLRTYVEGGGRLLVVVSVPVRTPPAASGGVPRQQDLSRLSGELEDNVNALLQQFGLSVTLVGKREGNVIDAENEAPRPALFPASVHGGTSSLKRKDGKPVLASVKVGKGQVTVYGDGALFSSSNMGSTAELPNPYKRSIYEFEYWLLRSELGLSPSPSSLDCSDRGHEGVAVPHDASSTDSAAP